MAWEVEERVSAILRKEMKEKPLTVQQVQINIEEAMKVLPSNPDKYACTADQLAIQVLSLMLKDSEDVEYIKFQLLCYYSYAWHYTILEKELADVKFYAVDWGWESPELREAFKKFMIWVDTEETGETAGKNEGS